MLINEKKNEIPKRKKKKIKLITGSYNNTK